MKSGRLQISLNDKQRSAVKLLATKYNRSQSEIRRVGRTLLEDQDKAGVEIPQLKKKK